MRPSAPPATRIGGLFHLSLARLPKGCLVLREHGNLPPRLLAEDIVARLDAVLDDVLRTLARSTAGA